MVRASKKSGLLEAAGSIILREGLGALTFDRLTAEAGVSKGGLLYHFPDKDRLLAALAEALVVRIDAAIAAQITAQPAEPGRWLRAYLAATVATDEHAARLLAILDAGLPPDSPARIALLSADRRWLAAACADGLPRGLAIAIRLAASAATPTRLDPADASAARDALVRLTQTAS